MTSSSFHLYQLQKIDLLIDHNNQQVNSIHDTLANNPGLKAAENILAEATLVFQKCSDELAQTEAAARAKQIKIEQSESSLYKGNISNPKELKDLQAEIASLKKALSQIEENQLLQMAAVEEAESTLKDAKSAYNSALQTAESENVKLIVELDAAKKNLETLVVEREVAIQQLIPESIAIYEKLRKSKNRIAIAPVEDESCAVCGSEIRVSDIQKSKTSSTLSFCPGCGRILYAG